MTTETSSPFRRSIQYLFDALIAPKAKDEDGRRRELILNIILVGSLVLLILLDCLVIRFSIIQGSLHQGISVYAFSGLVLFFGLLLLLSRKGNYVIASYLLIALYLISISYTAWRWGTDLPDALIGFAMVIIVSSILLSTKSGFITTGIIAVILNVLGYLYLSHHINPNLYWKNSAFRQEDMVKYTILLAFIAFVSWLSNRETERSLQRARLSERDLKEERDSLEIKVTERTKELKDAQAEKLSQLYKFIEFGKLSSGLFHDLINPLNAVSLNIAGLTNTSDPNLPATKTALERAVKASQRMEQFLANIRKQIQIREFETAFDLKKEIDDVLNLLHYKSAKQEVSLHADIPASLTLFGNPLKFNRVILNLISNAIDSYDDAGNRKQEFGVQITVHEAVSADSTQQTTIIQISDKGCGIAADRLQKIFDSFYTTKPPEKGSGLGLSIVKNIIEKDFKGTVTVVSEPGSGSVFTLNLPRRDHEAPSPSPSTDSS